MSDKSKETGLTAIELAADAVSKTDHNAALVTAGATAKAEAEKAKTDGEKSGALGAQARIKAILTHNEAAGRADLANHLAFNTSVSAEDAAGMLAAAPKAEAAKPGSRLDALMEGEKPKVDAVEAGKDTDIAAGLSAAVAKNLAKLGKAPLTVH